ncbi:MAG: hypothetical protein V8S27_05030 [Lachnospiraceae bacterium]
MVIGAGLLSLGLGLIGFVISWLLYLHFMPWCIRGIVNWISRILHGERRYAGQ